MRKLGFFKTGLALLLSGAHDDRFSQRALLLPPLPTPRFPPAVAAARRVVSVVVLHSPTLLWLVGRGRQPGDKGVCEAVISVAGNGDRPRPRPLLMLLTVGGLFPILWVCKRATATAPVPDPC